MNKTKSVNNNLLIIGSIAFDSIKTPFGSVEKALGGSAVYASLSSSFFVRPSIIGVVGKDFDKNYIELLEKHNVDTSGIKMIDGKTFFWQGYYDFDLNTAHTVQTQLNVFKNFSPELPEKFKNYKFVFLGNIDPELQYKIYKQLCCPYLVGLDTMNYWIENKFLQLKKMLKFVDILFINEAEIRQLTKEYNIIKSAKIVKSYGVKIVIVKRGEYGSICFYDNHIFVIPAYPLEKVYDPTGAGDSFAGAVMGYLSKKLSKNKKMKISNKVLRQAVIFGTILASFCVEDFSVNKLCKIRYNDIVQRYKEIKKLTHFEHIR